MKILHLLTSGNVGGIEVLCRDIGQQSEIDHKFAFLFGKGIIFDDMMSMQMQVYSLSKYKKISLKRLNEIRKIAEDCEVVIVHHNDPFLEFYYILLKICCPHKKYISMVHHCYDRREDREQYGVLKRILKNILISLMFRLSDKLFFVSRAGYQSYLQRFRVDDNKVAIIYNGIGEDKINEGEYVFKEKKNLLNVLYVGRLERIKGVDILIDAIRLLKSENIRLNIVGDGTQRLQLEEQVRAAGLEKVVTFHGFQNNVNDWFRDADIFVYPSRTEIFGLSLAEAMAFQCICVANNVGGIPEIIKDGYNGFLNRENTVEGLFSALCKAIDICGDGDRRSEMMHRARKTAEAFDIRRTVRQLEKEVQ